MGKKLIVVLCAVGLVGCGVYDRADESFNKRTHVSEKNPYGIHTYVDEANNIICYRTTSAVDGGYNVALSCVKNK